MNCTHKLDSPLGTLTLASDGKALTGLWLEHQKYYAAGLDPTARERPDLPVFRQAAAWLDAYFEKRPLPSLPPLAPRGSAFRQSVWKLLLEIPYGETTTYGALSRRLNAAGSPASPQAVGGAVGHNPISILIPCHRVLGADGSLTGYAGGVEKKRFLLALEGADLSRPHMPKRGSASARVKQMVYPTLVNGHTASSASQTTPPPETAEQTPMPGKFPCPCCGYRTFPVPKEDALAFICPVCFWENDLFTPGEDQPSDENRGLTLAEGRTAYRKLGAVQEEFLRYVRKPLPEEMP